MLFFHFHAALRGSRRRDIWLTVYSRETRETVADGTKRPLDLVQMGTVSQCGGCQPGMQSGGDGFVGSLRWADLL